MTNSQFSSLLKSTSLDKLKNAIKSADTTKGDRDDAGFWRPTVDSAGNAFAIIRFLPAPPPETVPFVSYYRHAFQGPNGWYIENSRTTLGEQDPCGEYNSRLWNTKDETYKTQARNQARKKQYVSNIYVVQDKGTPANEGKVFLFRYGQKIFDKIKHAIEPDAESGDESFDPFHIIEGANFRLRQKKQAGYPNYDDSKFEAPAAFLNGDEAAIMRVLTEGLKSLSELVSPDKFKSYEELKKRLDKSLGFDTAIYLNPNEAPSGAAAAKAVAKPKWDDDEDETPAAPAKVAVPVAKKWTPPSVDDDDEDDARLAQFDDEE